MKKLGIAIKVAVVILGILFLIPVTAVAVSAAPASDTEGFAYFTGDPYALGGTLNIYYNKGSGSLALQSIALYDPTGSLKITWTSFSVNGTKTYTAANSVSSMGQWHAVIVTGQGTSNDYAMMGTEYAEFGSTPYALYGIMHIIYKHWALGTMQITLYRPGNVYFTSWSYTSTNFPNTGDNGVYLSYEGQWKMVVITTNFGTWTRYTTVGHNSVSLVGGEYGSLISGAISVAYTSSSNSMNIQIFGPSSTSTPIYQISKPYNYPNTGYMNYSLVTTTAPLAGMYHVRAIPSSGNQYDFNARVGYVELTMSQCGNPLTYGQICAGGGMQILQPTSHALCGAYTVSFNVTAFSLAQWGPIQVPQLTLDVVTRLKPTINGTVANCYLGEEFVYVEKAGVFDPGLWVNRDYGSNSGKSAAKINWEDSKRWLIDQNCTLYQAQDGTTRAVFIEVLILAGGVALEIATDGIATPYLPVLINLAYAAGTAVISSSLENTPSSGSLHNVTDNQTSDCASWVKWEGNTGTYPNPTAYRNYSNAQFAYAKLTNSNYEYSFKVYAKTTYTTLVSLPGTYLWAANPIYTPILYVCVHS